MKRFVKIMSIAALFVCGMMLTGCAAANNIKEALSGPKDTWFRREITYKTSADSQGTTLVVFMRYSDTSSTVQYSNTDLVLGSGLNVVVITKDQSTSNSVISTLTKNKFLYKNFSDTDESTVEGGTDDGTDTSVKKIKMSTAKWNLLYNSVTMDNYGSSIPMFTEYSSWEKIDKPESFSWKKIMANYLLDRLLED